MRPWHTGPCRWAHWLCQAMSSPSILNTPTSMPSQEITLRLPSSNSSSRPTTYDFIVGVSLKLVVVSPLFSRRSPVMIAHLPQPPQGGHSENAVDRPRADGTVA